MNDMDRQEERDRLYKLLGELPPRDRAINAELLQTEETEQYVMETLQLDLNGFEVVPAYYLRPRLVDGPGPAILYNHAHGNEYQLGKDELIMGRSQLQDPPYAQVLTSLGYSVLCFDAWSFGGRAVRNELSIFKEMLWKGQVLWGMMVYDSLRALDYLLDRPETDPARVATLGLSMGSTMAWWLAALDKRVKVCVDICCLTDFQAFLEADSLHEHGIYYFVPDLLNHFTSAEINALIAPRPHLSLAGTLDPLTPPAGLDRIDAHLKEVYQNLGRPDAWKLLRYEVGHEETLGMREEIVAFLQENL
jgi:dienelactone hydrolase